MLQAFILTPGLIISSPLVTKFTLFPFAPARSPSASIRHLTLPFIDTTPGKWGSFSRILLVRSLRRIIHDIAPDILHAHFITSYGLLAALSNFRPLVLTVMGSDLLYARRSRVFWDLVARYVMKRADLVNPVARHLAELVARFGVPGHKIVTFQYGLDPHELDWLDDRRKGSLERTYAAISTRALEPVTAFRYSCALFLGLSPRPLGPHQSGWLRVRLHFVSKNRG